MRRLDAAEIHARLAGRWRKVLVSLGVPAEALRNRHGPCPGCGGTDRFRFDDRGRGAWICASGGGSPAAGDGFSLLMHVFGWGFVETMRQVVAAAGLEDVTATSPPVARSPATPPPAARPTARVRDLRRTSTSPDSVEDVVLYLASRRLWPLPAGCSLRAHAGAEYWSEREQIGRFPALLADVVDLDGDLVTLHTTYVHAGNKLVDYVARKLLSPLRGRVGCAVRLVPLVGDTLGIAEGIETALAAVALYGVPVWSAINTTLLAKWTPPLGVRRVVIYADRDVAGMEAAWRLRETLYGLGYRCEVELKLPPDPLGDFADCLMVGRS